MISPYFVYLKSTVFEVKAIVKGMSAKQELVQLFWGRRLRGEGAQGDNIPDKRKRICREPYMCSVSQPN